MLEMRLSTLVNQIVKHALEGEGRDDEALYLSFDLGMHKGEISQRRGLHLLYYRPRHWGSITVFSGVTRSPFAKIGEVTWKHETTHDSCWRDINVFSEVYFDMARCINEELVANGGEEIAPVMMTELHSFPLFKDTLYEWKKVSVTKDPTDQNNYRRMVTLL